MLRKIGQWKWYWLSARNILHCFPHQFSNSLKVEGQPIVRAIHTIFVSAASRCHMVSKSDAVKIRCTERNKDNQPSHFEFNRVGILLFISHSSKKNNIVPKYSFVEFNINRILIFTSQAGK